MRMLKIVCTIVLFSLITAHTAFAQADLANTYQFLSNTHVSQVVDPGTLLSHEGTLYSSADDKKIFTFPSTKKTNPHILYLDNSNTVTYLQLTIPSSDQERFTKLIADFGEPEKILHKTKSEILYTYPSKGVSIVIDGYTNFPDRAMYYQVKTLDQHLQQEAVNYVASSRLTQSKSSLLDRLDLPKVYKYLGWVVALIGLVMGWFFVRKHKARS